MISIANFKEYLELSEITSIKGRGTELITLFIPRNMKLHQILTKLKFERNECKNIKAKQTKKALEISLKGIISFLEKEYHDNTVSKVIFSGLVNDQYFFKSFNTLVNIPFKYCCSDTFNTTGYYDGLAYSSYYLVIVDLNGATVGLKSTQGIKVLKNFDSYIPSKTRKGGQSSRRYAEIRVNETRELFGRIATYCRAVDLATPRPFLVGGGPPTVDKFLSDKHLPDSIKKKTSGPYYLQNDEEAGLEELVSFSKVSELEREKAAQIAILGKKNYSANSVEKLKNYLFLVPLSLLGNKKELEIINSAEDSCKVLLIEDYTSLGAQFNGSNKIRIVPLE